MRSKFVGNPVPTGTGMNRLKGYQNAHIRKQYWRLTEGQRDEVKQAADRYYTACSREGVDTDPEFFKEVILDLRDSAFVLEVDNLC